MTVNWSLYGRSLAAAICLNISAIAQQPQALVSNRVDAAPVVSNPVISKPALPETVAVPAIDAASLKTDAGYVLGPDDQIAIHIVDMDEISDKPVRVDPNGYVDLPLVGRVRAAGSTVEQFKVNLTKVVKRFVTEPQISVNVTEYKSQSVSIIGAVNSPGVHQLSSPKRLIEVLSLAGGMRPEAGSKLRLTRQAEWGMLPLPGAKRDQSGQFSTAELNMDELTSSKHPAENIRIYPNDIISVAKAELVYVVGEVKKAGGFTLQSHETMSLLQAVSLAEGLQPNASAKKAKIIRPAGAHGEVNEIAVDLRGIMQGRTPDMTLHANDVLFVPNNVPRSAGLRAAEMALQVAAGVAIYRR